MSLIKDREGILWQLPLCHWELNALPRTKQWLLFRGSITQQLNQLGLNDQEQVTIKILRESLLKTRPLSPEDKFFHCKYLYSREIQLYLGKTLVMYARSLMPKDESSLIKKQFRNLQNRALGTLLFGSIHVRRSPFLVAKIRPDQESYHLATDPALSMADPVWARCSHFSRTDTEIPDDRLSPFLLLTEFFSPTFIHHYSLC